MSKTKHKHRIEDDFDDGVDNRKPGNNRHKERRIDRALRTKNIDELMELDDDYNDDEPEESQIARMERWDDEE